MVMNNAEFKEVRLKVPVQHSELEQLEIGMIVYLDGVIYTGREGVYKRILEDGHDIPLDLPALSNANFHCSPAAAIEDDGSFNVGGVTATASFRFAKWMKQWFEKSGAKIIIGKGGMSSEQYKELFVPARAVYLTTVGYGTGALLGRGIKRVKQVEWYQELGNAQAMWVFEVEDFGPFIVDSDLQGRSLFEEQGELINEKLGKLYDGLKPPALSRYGETDDRNDELI
ncbi:MAG: fumarate hydratase [Gammaproteobacteria bacterium]|nr:fumarate hydratase [Gammaproteobacteria bacterium]